MDHLANTDLPLQQQEANWCRDALQVQNASNVTGVAYALQCMLQAMGSTGMSTSARCEHPATRLFVAKLADMVGLHYEYPREIEIQASSLISQSESSPSNSY